MSHLPNFSLSPGREYTNCMPSEEDRKRKADGDKVTTAPEPGMKLHSLFAGGAKKAKTLATQGNRTASTSSKSTDVANKSSSSSSTSNSKSSSSIIKSSIGPPGIVTPAPWRWHGTMLLRPVGSNGMPEASPVPKEYAKVFCTSLSSSPSCFHFGHFLPLHTSRA
jgi:hypothetical protein